ncbi:TonB-dependent Receptor Plug Domain [Sphingomonas laterariae]|uniref:TonB-dependent Receptor Plug Domain n=1 Tax=Edaphosphingomonas laterariae TaxID=861865 RepID=A0A239HYF8_9SPHN|nr:TonB-dependent receptor [Sphingomonas laterariae]SNS86400.1 TonB-dependent Receptor Plug Domain [Sphingomonas laterariae]
MFQKHKIAIRTILLTGAALAVASPLQGAMAAETRAYAIAAQDLGPAIRKFAIETGRDVAFDPAVVAGKKTRGVRGERSDEEALRALLEGTGLRYTRTATGFAIVAGSGETTSADPTAETQADIIVTAQKKEESIQAVPIAITAMTEQVLDERKIESGQDLVRGVPNLNFTKTFSSMYNITIRGIGTKALNSSSDPGVAIAYNNTPLIRNRLFEQEFFDMSRIEVLRGPQGTLYGRNATAGVINVIPAMPSDRFEGELKGETGNYSSRRLSGMINVPLADNFAIRAAGAFTDRDGYDYNTFTNQRVNGRHLWSTRLSAKWEPSDGINISGFWEHFDEDDNRARSGKALCTTDPGPEMVGDTEVPDFVRGSLSQGCKNATLYDDAAFGVPNASSLPFVIVGQVLGNATVPDPTSIFGVRILGLLKAGDPYAGIVQSRNVREIATGFDPIFRAKNDIAQFNFDVDLGGGLTFYSQSAYSRDKWYSSQDYNRFISNPAFTDPVGEGGLNAFLQPFTGLGPAPGGVFTDPQLGASDRILGVDLNQTDTRQWTQEFRLQSDWDGPVNFTAGVNYIDFKTEDDYYAFNNVFNLIAQYAYNIDASKLNSFTSPTIETVNCPRIPDNDPSTACMYVDTNPIGQLDNQGHNYFLSKNKVRTKSTGIFGELYVTPTDDTKLTFGLRYTDDRKYQSQIPSQLLLNSAILTGGLVDSGYPPAADINQKWGKFTGRVVFDWKPNLSFTDDTLIYASASRGYKAGGANPPRVDFNPVVVQYQPLPATYKPEYVNAFEIGAKNTLMNGKLTLNASAFYYDYKDYQTSAVTDRITATENVPATVWGAELEAAWRPSRSFRVDGSLGYLRTRIKNGAQAIDVMDRTQGNPDWVTLRPWLQVPSNCIAPKALVEKTLQTIKNFGLKEQPFLATTMLASMCPGATGIGTYNPNVPMNIGTPYYFFTGFTYDPFAPYNPATVGLNIADGGSGAPNGGRGFYADLGGNELPNAPRITFNIGAQYTLFFDNDDWELTLRGDYYRQSSSYARIFNGPIDKLKSWDNVNISLTLARPDDNLAFQLYVKNVFDNQPITDTFISADDIGLPANTFYLDPRIIGFSASFKF